MRIATIATALLLPLLAVADEQPTTTLTSTRTLYQTVTIQRVVATTTSTWHNATSYLGTGTGSFHVSATHTTSSSTGSATIASATASGGAAGLRDAAGVVNLALAGVAGMVVAAVL